MNMENPHPQAQEIVEALSSADSETIRDAAFKAGDLGLEEAVPQLCELIKSPSVGVQEAAEYALRKIRGPQVVGALLPLLRSDEAPVRNVAMDILREIGVDSIESMQPYLMDEDPDLRIFITDILGYCRTHQASLLLGRALLKDPEVNVRYQAAVSLGNLAFPEAVGVLVQLYLQSAPGNFAVISAAAALLVLSCDWLFFYRMPGYSGSAQRYLWFVLPSAALTIPASLVEFAIVRHIYNKFKIDNGVV